MVAQMRPLLAPPRALQRPNRAVRFPATPKIICSGLVSLTLLNGACFSEPGSSSENGPGATSSSGTTEGDPTQNSEPATSSVSDAEVTSSSPPDDTTTLSSEGTTTDVPSTCGDARLDAEEACDDGNTRSQDGCDADCSLSTGVRDVSVAEHHTCVLLFDGRVRCWGEVVFGTLGHGNGVQQDIGDDELPWTVGDVPLPSGVEALESGSRHTCALYDTGAVRCWGRGARGRLGYGNTDNVGDNEGAGTPGEVMVGEPVASLGLGSNQTCAILESGSLRCWGNSEDGRLGYGADINSDVGDDEFPDAVGNVPLGDNGLVSVASGQRNTCAAFDSGTARCWGNYNGEGLLGPQASEPIGDNETAENGYDLDFGRVVITKVTVGPQHACALTETGGVFCWGRGAQGRLGYASTADIGNTNEPVEIGEVPLANGDIAVDVEVGRAHSCVLLESGGVRCWGANELGQLGLGHTDSIGDDESPGASPEVDAGGPVVAIDTQYDHTCVLLEDGAVRCWGQAENGKLGYGNLNNIGDNETPATVSGVVVLTP